MAVKVEVTEPLLAGGDVDPLETLLAIAFRVGASEIVRDCHALAERVLDTKAAIAIVGARLVTRATLNSCIGRPMLASAMQCTELVLTHGRRARALVHLDDSEYRAIDLTALDEYLRCLAETTSRRARVEIMVPHLLPEDVCLVEMPVAARAWRAELTQRLEGRDYRAAVIVVEADQVGTRQTTRLVRWFEEQLGEVVVMPASVREPWTAIAELVHRHSSESRLSTLQHIFETELLELVGRLQRYLREYRRALIARPDETARRVHQLVAQVDTVGEAIDVCWASLAEEREHLLRTLEQERTKFLMGDTADLLTTLADRIELMPQLDPSAVSELTRTLVRDEIARWRACLSKHVASSASLLCHLLLQGIRQVGAEREACCEAVVTSAVVLGASSYGFHSLAPLSRSPWTVALRPFRSHSMITAEWTRAAVDLAHDLLSRNTRDAIEDFVEMVAIAMQRVAGHVRTSIREIAAAAHYGACVAESADRISAAARPTALRSADDWLDRVQALGHWVTLN